MLHLPPIKYPYICIFYNKYTHAIFAPNPGNWVRKRNKVYLNSILAFSPTNTSAIGRIKN